MISKKLLFGLSLILCLYACETSEAEDDQEESGNASGGVSGDSSGGEVNNVSEELFRIDLNSTSLNVGDEVGVRAFWIVDDEEMEVSTEAEWESTDTTVLTVEARDDSVQVTAVSSGAATLKATYEGKTQSVDLTVVGVDRLIIEGAPDEVRVGSSFTLTVSLQNSDGSSTEPTEGVTWESLTSAATVDETGEVSVISHGQIQIKVTVNDLSETWEREIPCSYPEPSGTTGFNTRLEIGTVMPPLRWDRGYSAVSGEEVPVSLEQIYCSDEFSWVKTVNILITAGWCSACPSYLRAVSELNPELEDEGGLLIYIEVENEEGDSASSSFAQRFLSRLLGSTPGYFVGDIETKPVPRFFKQSPAIEAFPDAYVVRKSDMTLISSQNLNRSVGMLPFVAMAQDPTQDWSTIQPPPFESICVDGDDEPSEPNNTVEEAGSLEPGVHSAGICDENPDFFSTNVAGNWKLRIEFSHAEADLDLFHLNPADPDGQAIAVSNGTDDFEEITGSGPALFGILSYTRTSTLYTITFDEL